MTIEAYGGHAHLMERSRPIRRLTPVEGPREDFSIIINNEPINIASARERKALDSKIVDRRCRMLVDPFSAVNVAKTLHSNGHYRGIYEIFEIGVASPARDGDGMRR